MARAWELYYRGLSLRNIKQYLKIHFGTKNLSHSTIFYWVQHCSEIMNKYTIQFLPKSIDTLHADETTLKVAGTMHKGYCDAWLWVGIDLKSKLLVSTYISQGRTLTDATKFVNGIPITPKRVITDALPSYIIPIKQKWNNKARHIVVKNISSNITNNVIERFNGFVKDRTKPMRGFGAMHSAETYFKGLSVYNNFIKPHSSLDGKTPAEFLGIDLGLADNPVLDILKRSI